jgi:FKBP-type peptidyl-prolyl cis-trans isomerase SlyD
VKIAKDRVVTIDYTIRLDDGRIVETSVADGGAPLLYLHGRSQIVPGVEKAIEGAEPGSVMEVDVVPEDAYGARDPAGVFMVPRAAFPPGETVGPGMAFSATRLDGKQMTFHVLEVREDTVVIDTNHPLAGRMLHISVAVRAVRDATEEELHAGRPLGEAPMAQIPS